MKATKLLGLFSAAILAISSLPQMPVSAAEDYQLRDVKDGYNWELWNQYGQGSAQMQVGDAGTYTCTWSGIHNVLFRSGKKFENYPQWKTLDSIKLDYEASVYQPKGNSYLCVYGWTKSPLVEYYIVENYGSWRPPGTSDKMSKVGTIEVDGGTYEVYKGTHDGPSIEPGVTHFNQYWSVRVDGQLRNKGQIDIAKHFEAWENKYNMQMGGLYEVALNVEGWQSSGTATISKNNLDLKGETVIEEPQDGPLTLPEPDVAYTAPSGKGTSVTDDFEGSGTLWASRGEPVKYGFTKDFVHGGKQSLYVTGREDSWQGVSAASDELKAGETYDFSSYVGYQNDNYTSLKYELGIQYKLNDKTNYDNLASTEVSNGKWSELAAKIEVPEGATDISLYVQSEYTESPTKKDMVSFFLDDVKLTSKSVQTTPSTTESTTTSSTTSSSTTSSTTVTSTSVTTSESKTTQTTGVKATMKGDVNCDEKVDVSDAVLLARFVAEDAEANVTEVGKKNAETDGNAGITGDDVIMILRVIAKLATF